jgi:hypothetical protein
LVEETTDLSQINDKRKPPTYRKSHNVVSSTARNDLTTLVVIGTDCTGSCKSNYHMITMAPKVYREAIINKIG